MSNDVDLTAFEGLVFATAARYEPILDADLDDLRQILRVKVWEALVAYDRSRVVNRPIGREQERDARERYVFMCLRNRVKDLLKEQDRLNTRRNGGQLHIADVTDDLETFEGRYLAADDPNITAVEDKVELPSTLSRQERELVALLLLYYRRGEISVLMGITRKRVLAMHRSVQEKMADWRPSDLGEFPDSAAMAGAPRLILASVET